MSDATAFLAQNDLTAKDLTDDDRATVELYAEHHSGGLMVLGRDLGDGQYVKMHDSWGDDGKIVVHTYASDDADVTRDDVAYFDSGHEALAAFLAVDDPAAAAREAINALLARDSYGTRSIDGRTTPARGFLSEAERKALTDVLGVIA